MLYESGYANDYVYEQKELGLDVMVSQCTNVGPFNHKYEAIGV